MTLSRPSVQVTKHAGAITGGGSVVNYVPTGSGDAVPSSATEPPTSLAGDTAFVYNLTIGGTRITNLQLSGGTVAKIFTRVITRWDDPTIQAKHPQLTLPALAIVPVVRSDEVGTTMQFTRSIVEPVGMVTCGSRFGWRAWVVGK
jgi:hypothetical protein